MSQVSNLSKTNFRIDLIKRICFLVVLINSLQAGKFFMNLCSLLIFFKIIFFEKKFRNTIRVSNILDPDQARPRGYKTFFMLNSTEQEIWTAHKAKMLKNKDFSFLRTLRCFTYPANKF